VTTREKVLFMQAEANRMGLSLVHAIEDWYRYPVNMFISKTGYVVLMYHLCSEPMKDEEIEQFIAERGQWCKFPDEKEGKQE